MIDCKQNGEWSSLDIETSIHPTVLIVGLGNPILGDDGIGWRVAEKVAQQLHLTPTLQSITPKVEFRPSFVNFEVDCLAVGGLALMERLIGYERAIIIDAISTDQHPLGAVSKIPLSELPDHALGHLCSAHDTTLQNALRLGRSMGAKIPDDIVVVGIEIQQVYDFSDELSPAVLNAIPDAFDVVMELLK
jgi:hydrogenase maturation protease